MSILCKWLIIGDSLAVGLGGFMADANYDHALVSAGIDKTYSIVESNQDQLKDCKNLVISLGSNVLFNDSDKEVKKYRKLIAFMKSKQNFDNIYLMPVPAKGKYRQRADIFNEKVYKMSEEMENGKFLPILPGLQRRMSGDNIHLKKGAMLIWKKQLEKEYELSSSVPGRCAEKK